MFSGIISAAGTVVNVVEKAGGKEFSLSVDKKFLDDVIPGASIAVNGACQTLETNSSDSFSFFSSTETLTSTNLSRLLPGTKVNLEKAMTLATPLDGHMVSGHVDAMAPVTAIRQDGETWLLEIELPRDLVRFVAVKGSLAVDGISLTVNKLTGSRAAMTVIPFTYQHTTLYHRKPGDAVNIEVDIFARYIFRYLEQAEGVSKNGLLDTLKNEGFIS